MIYFYFVFMTQLPSYLLTPSVSATPIKGSGKASDTMQIAVISSDLKKLLSRWNLSFSIHEGMVGGYCKTDNTWQHQIANQVGSQPTWK